ncbi:esterase/lipase family protein [Scytonema sp. PRP1]|uniref:esterase/lipase family protein n=1 Tax=Scytonema sp. PRP1 TaxID=3120513 RepID=UPI002FD36213
MADPKLIPIIGCDNSNRSGDVIFVHGLGGDGLTTWHTQPQEIDTLRTQPGKKFKPAELSFWPAWLGQERTDLGIWSLDYDIEPSDWHGPTLPLAKQANLILKVLENRRIGQRPLVFITHSMGGLLVKQMLRSALDFGPPRWKQIVEQTKGIVFLATPHTGSSRANFAQSINSLLLNIGRLTVSVEELQHGHSRLLELDEVYWKHERLRTIPVQCYGETAPLGAFGIIVDAVSAKFSKDLPLIEIPGADHLTICKIASAQKEDSVVYNSTLLFLEDCFPPQTPVRLPMALKPLPQTIPEKTPNPQQPL